MIDAMKALADLIARRLGERDVSFVFPSGTAADSWARKALGLAPGGAVESGRFVAWDSFRDLVFGGDSGERKADSRVRTLWAASVLAENAAKPFLRALVRPEYAAAWLVAVPFVATVPRDFGLVREKLAGDEPALADLAALVERYDAFLRKTDVRESAWNRIPSLPARGRWIVIAPELMEDFSDYAASLAGLDRVTVVPLAEAATESLPSLLAFPNVYEELRWAFAAIARGLDEGTRPEDYAVTVVDPVALRPWIERVAADYGVPVALRSGQRLSKYPAGRFLSAIADCAKRRFDFDSVSALLLDGFPPWKKPERMRALVRFGIDAHAYAPWTEGGTPVDAWERSFDARRDDSGLSLRALYGALKRRVDDIAKAPDFSALQVAFQTFRGNFIDEDAWDPDAERSLQRAMEELRALAGTEDELGLKGALGDPFSLFLASLDGLPYVPRTGGAAVSVFPYRVSALVAPERHFVLGCSQDGVDVRYDPASCLREDLRAAVGKPRRDASPDFLRAYAASGSVVTASYAAFELGGWAIPHAAFAAVAPPDDYDRVRASDPGAVEASFWRGESALPARLSAARVEAATRAATAAVAPPAPLSETAVRAVTDRRSESGKLTLSQSDVRDYQSCRFKWLLARGFRLVEEKSGVTFFDDRLKGDALHGAMELLTERVAAMDAVPDPARIGEYKAMIPRAIADIVERLAKKDAPFLEPMLDAYVPLMTDRLGRMLELGLERLPGWAIGRTESSLAKEYDDVVLVGRIDRLAERGDELAVIDYKKRKLPDAKGVYADQAGTLADPQAAAYVVLAEAGGKRAVRAEYWSFEDAKDFAVVHPDGGSDGAPRTREAFDAEVAAFEAALGATAAGISAGRFTERDAERGDCGSCAWRSVCRANYETER